MNVQDEAILLKKLISFNDGYSFLFKTIANLRVRLHDLKHVQLPHAGSLQSFRFLAENVMAYQYEFHNFEKRFEEFIAVGSYLQSVEDLDSSCDKKVPAELLVSLNHLYDQIIALINKAKIIKDDCKNTMSSYLTCGGSYDKLKVARDSISQSIEELESKISALKLSRERDLHMAGISVPMIAIVPFMPVFAISSSGLSLAIEHYQLDLNSLYSEFSNLNTMIQSYEQLEFIDHSISMIESHLIELSHSFSIVIMYLQVEDVLVNNKIVNQSIYK